MASEIWQTRAWRFLMAKLFHFVSFMLAAILFTSILIFIIFIPTIVHPEIQTILANFDSDPVVCSVQKYSYKEGLSNCTWSACREGCTNPLVRCHEIYVRYSSTYFDDFQRNGKAIDWKPELAKLFVNSHGCGYRPDVNCNVFIEKYSQNSQFPCFYSRTYSDFVVANFSRAHNLKNLILSITVPSMVSLFAAFSLSFLHYPEFFYYIVSLARNRIFK